MGYRVWQESEEWWIQALIGKGKKKKKLNILSTFQKQVLLENKQGVISSEQQSHTSPMCWVLMNFSNVRRSSTCVQMLMSLQPHPGDCCWSRDEGRVTLRPSGSRMWLPLEMRDQSPALLHASSVQAWRPTGLWGDKFKNRRQSLAFFFGSQ